MESCPTCGKTPELCLCADAPRLENRRAVLFFQHPQEPDKALGSARLAHRALANSVLKVALSVPNLRRATGREDAVPSKWGVLYLGSGIKADTSPGPGLYPVKKDGSLLPPREAKEILDSL